MEDDNDNGDATADDRMQSDSPASRWLSGSHDDGMGELSEVDRWMIASCISNIDITEEFSPERINKLAARFGLVPGALMDLTTGYDFTKEADRKRAWKHHHAAKPYIVVGSPPCTVSIQLQELNKHVHRQDPE